MEWLRTAALVAIISTTAGVVSAHTHTSALDIASYCKPIAEATPLSDGRVGFAFTYKTGKCWGFFDAVQQASRLWWIGHKNPVLGFCAPAEGTLTQLVKVFQKYVQEHPAKADEEALIVAHDALLDAFPCKD